MANTANVAIQSSQVPADQTDFPVLVDLSDLPAGFWSIVANGGGDIRVFKSDGTTELAREVVSCDTATDTGELWVKYAGTLSSSMDTTIQIHADGVSSDYAVTATYGRNAVWSDYAVVMHLTDLTDSTGNTSPTVRQTATPASVTAQIGGAYSFNGSDSAIDVVLPAPVTSYTSSLQAWGKTRAGTTSTPLIAMADKDRTDEQYRLQARDIGRAVIYSVFNDASSDTTPAVATDELWHLQAGVTSSNSRRDYVKDGVFLGNSTDDATVVGVDRVTLGTTADSTPYGYWDGWIDEARLMWSVPATSQLETEYNNQSSPDTFYTVTAPATGPSTPINPSITNLLATSARLNWEQG